MPDTGHLEHHPVLEPVLDVGDLLDDPRTDIEALCLCALLWAPTAAAATVTELLQATDFHDPTHGDLFTLLATQVHRARPHDPASLAAALTDTGQAAGHHGTQLTRALARATAAGAAPEAAGHYALAVATAAYRRGFHTAATALTQAAQQLPTNDLFDHLLTIGQERRTATTRLRQLRDALDPPSPPRRRPPVPAGRRRIMSRHHHHAWWLPVAGPRTPHRVHPRQLLPRLGRRRPQSARRVGGCTLLAGTLDDHYSTATITFTFTHGPNTSADVQVDHVVPTAAT